MNKTIAKVPERWAIAGNAYFFTGRRLDAFDFDAGGGGESAMGGGGLTTGSESLSTGDMSFWLCFYSSAGGPENPLDFDGSGSIDDADLTWFDNCVADAGGTMESTTESALTEPLAGESAGASAGSVPRLVLYHYRARAHDPGLGRFMQRDPREFVDGMNVYEYVSSRPVLYVDPYGLEEECCSKKNCKWSGNVSVTNLSAFFSFRVNASVVATATDDSGCTYAVSGKGTRALGGGIVGVGHFELSGSFENVSAPCMWPVSAGNEVTAAIVGLGGAVAYPLPTNSVNFKVGRFDFWDYAAAGGWLNVWFAGGGIIVPLQSVSHVGPTPPGA